MDGTDSERNEFQNTQTNNKSRIQLSESDATKRICYIRAYITYITVEREINMRTKRNVKKRRRDTRLTVKYKASSE